MVLVDKTEESPLSQAVARERLLETLQAEEGLACSGLSSGDQHCNYS